MVGQVGLGLQGDRIACDESRVNEIAVDALGNIAMGVQATLFVCIDGISKSGTAYPTLMH